MGRGRYDGWILVMALIMLSSSFIGCAKEERVCASPYTLINEKCCLDKDANSVCDGDETAAGKLDCSLCAPQFVTETKDKIVYKYVCVNESVVDTPEECGERITSNAHLFTTSRTQSPDIDLFDADPACRGKFQTAELHVRYDAKPQRISLQVQDEPQGSYKERANLTISDDIYYYIGFCKDCQQLIDLQLDPTHAYAVRVMLEYPDRKSYSKELVLDPTPSGDIGKMRC